MFLRKLKNASHTISFQIVEKVGRTNKLVKHLGTAKTIAEQRDLEEEAKLYLEKTRLDKGIVSLFDSRFETGELDRTLSRFEFLAVHNTNLYRFLLRFHDLLGFGGLSDPVFRDLMLARIMSPLSKVKTRDYLENSLGIKYSLSSVYRCLKLAYKNNYQNKLEELVLSFVKQYVSPTISVLFFDVTTLYFEAHDEDDFRKCGFSKDHKNNQPQVVVSLTVTHEGFPLNWQIFSGETYEGHTLLPCIRESIKRTGAQKLVVVADAGMLNKKNLDSLEADKLHYIVGARLHQLSDKFKEKIAKIPKRDKTGRRFELSNTQTLLVTYSTKRAAKNKADRKKQVEKAKKALAKGKEVSGRLKYLSKSEPTTWVLNKELIAENKKYDGLKGYITNYPKLSNREILKRYSDLWRVENAFRMSKSDLLARPIFHTLEESIKAHLTLVFGALAISRYIEYLTHKSIKKVVEVLSQAQEIIIRDTVTKQITTRAINPSYATKLLLNLTRK